MAKLGAMIESDNAIKALQWLSEENHSNTLTA